MSNKSQTNKRRLTVLFSISLVLPILIDACGGAVTTAPSAPTQAPTVPVQPTSVPPTTTLLPVVTDTSAPTVLPTDTPVIDTPTPEAMTANPTIDTQQGEALLNVRCTACHSLDRVKREHKSQEEWNNTIARMVNKGAQLSEEEKVILAAYLASTY